MSGGLRIHPVSGKRDLKTFIRVPFSLYRDDPNWVPPLMVERLESLGPKNPYFKHATAKYWIAYRDDKPVGRISAQVDKLALKHIHPGLGHFGLFECEENPETAKALFKAAEDWLNAQGMSKMQGPFNLSINEECGLLIDGFNTPPMVMMGHARPYYQKFYKSAGLKKEKDMYAYILDITKNFPEKVLRLVQIAERSKAIEIRDLDMKNYYKDLESFFSIFNDAWSGNWGYIPFTKDEAVHAAKSMKPLMTPYRVRICNYKGEPSAFMVTIPDLNYYIRDFNGRLFPFNFIRLLWRLKFWKPKRVRVPLMGVRQHLQGTRAGGGMAFLLIETIRQRCIRRGTIMGELSWILEDNMAMRRILEAIGCEIYKTYRMYEKDL